MEHWSLDINTPHKSTKFSSVHPNVETLSLDIGKYGAENLTIQSPFQAQRLELGQQAIQL